MILKGKRIIVKLDTPIEKTTSGIFLPQTSQKPSNIGTIILIGEEVDQELLGKEVMFHIEASQNFDFDDIQGKLIFPTDIIATLN